MVNGNLSAWFGLFVPKFLAVVGVEVGGER